jgi:cytidylate kinase
MTGGRNVGALIERHAAWSALHQRLETAAGAVEARGWKQGPWLTVSRQIGSGGSELATALARALGWDLLDRQMVAEVAKLEHASPSTVKAHDEHPTGPVRDYLAHLLVPDDPGQLRILERMAAIAVDRARKGRVVFVGRGVNWILDRRYGLRLRAVAPFELRVAAVAERDRLGRAEAERRVRSNDAEQAAFIRATFDRDINDPLGYDLVLNLGDLGVPAAAAIVTTAIERRLQDPPAQG